ncbi:MAG: hypothetical protein AAF492_06265, partial [Verrucomicrobiota bacterium]
GTPDAIDFEIVNISVCYHVPATIPAFDVLYIDEDSWSDSHSNEWKRLKTVSGYTTIDGAGNGGRPGPGELNQGGNRSMRFYRVAEKDAWQPGNTPSVASEEIYLAMPIQLYPGQNWIGLPGDPDTLTPAAVLGHGLPAAVLLAGATRVSWLNAGKKSTITATNQIYLATDGGTNLWKKSTLVGPADPADHMPIPRHGTMMVEIPTNLPVQQFVFVGRLPLSAATPEVAGEVGAAEAHVTLVCGSGLPVALHPSELNLFPSGPASHSSGFQGCDIPRLLGPDSIDLMWKFSGLNQQIPAGEIIWYRTSDNSWRFLSAGFPLVPAGYFKPGEAFVIKRTNRPTNPGYLFAVPLPYSPPNDHVNP